MSSRGLLTFLSRGVSSSEAGRAGVRCYPHDRLTRRVRCSRRSLLCPLLSLLSLLGEATPSALHLGTIPNVLDSLFLLALATGDGDAERSFSSALPLILVGAGSCGRSLSLGLRRRGEDGRRGARPRRRALLVVPLILRFPSWNWDVSFWPALPSMGRVGDLLDAAWLSAPKSLLWRRLAVIVCYAAGLRSQPDKKSIEL